MQVDRSPGPRLTMRGASKRFAANKSVVILGPPFEFKKDNVDEFDF